MPCGPADIRSRQCTANSGRDLRACDALLVATPLQQDKGGCHTPEDNSRQQRASVPGKPIWPEGGRQEATVNAAPAAAKAMTLNEPPFLNTRCAASHAAGRETELVSLRRGKQSVSCNAVSLCVVFGSRITARSSVGLTARGRPRGATHDCLQCGASKRAGRLLHDFAVDPPVAKGASRDKVVRAAAIVPRTLDRPIDHLAMLVRHDGMQKV